MLVGHSAKARKGTTTANVNAVFEIADPDWLHDRVRGGLGSGEGVIFAVCDEQTKDKRLLVLEPEFARVLAIVERRRVDPVPPILRDALR